MTYAFIRDVPISEDQYREVRAEIGDEVPKGLLTHLVFRRDDGLRYIDVWDSQADWERFREERVDPAVHKMMAAHGITPPDAPLTLQPIDVIDAWVG